MHILLYIFQCICINQCYVCWEYDILQVCKQNDWRMPKLIGYKRNKMTYVILLHIYICIYQNICSSWGNSLVVLYIYNLRSSKRPILTTPIVLYYKKRCLYTVPTIVHLIIYRVGTYSCFWCKFWHIPSPWREGYKVWDVVQGSFGFIS